MHGQRSFLRWAGFRHYLQTKNAELHLRDREHGLVKHEARGRTSKSASSSTPFPLAASLWRAAEWIATWASSRRRCSRGSVNSEYAFASSRPAHRQNLFSLASASLSLFSHLSASLCVCLGVYARVPVPLSHFLQEPNNLSSPYLRHAIRAVFPVCACASDRMGRDKWRKSRDRQREMCGAEGASIVPSHLGWCPSL
jgi:hypothetical protein